jgi:hypothetical protein
MFLHLGLDEQLRMLLRGPNVSVAGPSGFERLAVLIKNKEGSTVGGLWGKFSYDWLTVELLFAPSELRGQGLVGGSSKQPSKLLRAEAA